MQTDEDSSVFDDAGGILSEHDDCECEALEVSVRRVMHIADREDVRGDFLAGHGGLIHRAVRIE
jgi:hypothetical protein